MTDQRIANNLKMQRDALKSLPPTVDRRKALLCIEEAYALLAPYRPIDLPELQAERDTLTAEVLRAPYPDKVKRLQELLAQLEPLEAIKEKGRVL